MKKIILSLFVLSIHIIISCSKDDDIPNTAPTMSDQAFTAAEDLTNIEEIGIVVAVDKESAADLVFKITSNSSMLFEMDDSSGSLFLASGQSLDFETSEIHTIEVNASDGKLDASATITINVTDINEVPEIVDQQFSTEENIDETTIIGTVDASDIDAGSSLTFSIVTNDNDLFEIDGTSGNVSLISGQNLDFETSATHSLVVGISDGNLTSTADVNISVTNINEPPAITDQMFTVSEDIDDTYVIGKIIASDEDAGTALTYGVDNPSQFRIDGSGNLNLAFGTYLDFETASNLTFNVAVSDGSFSESATITLDITNIIDINVTTIAGITGWPGSTDGHISVAKFYYPTDIAYDQSGNAFIADRLNHTIRKIDVSGNVTTLAGLATISGTADGQGSVARFKFPTGIAVDASGNVYVADSYNHTIRKIDQSGNVTTFAGNPGGGTGSTDGLGSLASFNIPVGLEFDNSGNLYVADTFNNAIRKIDQSGNVTTFAGSAGAFGLLDGQGITAQFHRPTYITIDNSGNLYVTDVNNHAIRKIDPAGNVSTIAGNGTTGTSDGQGASAHFHFPMGIAVDTNGDLIVSDLSNHTIRKVDPTGNVTTIAGLATVSGSVDGPGNFARFTRPYGVGIDGLGNIVIAGFDTHSIRKIEIR